MAGTSAINIARAVVSRSRSRRTRSTTNADSASTSRSLPSSDGWNESRNRSNERRDPRAVVPAAMTSRISPIIVA